MELIDRYLQAVKFWLPNEQKEDIITELSADLYAQVEDREAGLGRKLATPEIEAILKERGRPFLVANRFLPQQSLIGPALFPVYRYVMRMAFLCYFVPWVVLSIGLAIYSPAYQAGTPRPSWLIQLANVPGHMWNAAFGAFAVITVIFAILERAQTATSCFNQWEPRELPPLRNFKAIPRFSSTLEMVVNWVFFTWWAANFHTTELYIGSSIHVSLTPVWFWFYWAYFILALANATLAGANLIRPYWTPVRATLRMLLDAAGAIVFCCLLKANLLVGIAIATDPAEKSLAITQAIRSWMPTIFPFAVALALLITGINVYRILRVGRKTGSPALPGAQHPGFPA